MQTNEGMLNRANAELQSHGVVVGWVRALPDGLFTKPSTPFLSKPGHDGH